MGVSGVGRRGDLERGSSARLEGLVVCHSAFDLHADGLCHPASCDDCPLELQSVGQRVLAGGGRGGAGAGARCCWSGCLECGSQERVHVRYTLSVSSPESQQSERCEPLSLLRLTADSDSDSLFHLGLLCTSLREDGICCSDPMPPAPPRGSCTLRRVSSRPRPRRRAVRRHCGSRRSTTGSESRQIRRQVTLSQPESMSTPAAGTRARRRPVPPT